MSEYALLVNGTFDEIRQYETKPQNIPHKGITWHEVFRVEGETVFVGLENDIWVIRKASLNLQELKLAKISDLANIRWSKETGGTSYNGYALSTDPVSQTKYVGAVVGVQIDPTAVINWKMSDGSFIQLDASGVTSMAMTVRAHIQACFDKESELRTLIEAATSKEELEAIDITVGWP